MYTELPVRILCALTLCHCCPSPAVAASSTIGSTAAVRCHQESLFPLSDQGIRYCNDAISRGELNRHDLAATYTNRGIIYSKNGKFKRALKDHNRAVQINPNLPQIYINRGNVFYHIHEYEDAITEFDKAIATGGGPVSVTFHNKALALIKLHRISEAKEALKMALEANPDSKRIQDRLSEITELDQAPL
jgi:tetratricopeptide (TPR) repeat protein